MKSKELVKMNTSNFKCIDGPLAGSLLRFSIDGSTFVFTVKGQTGQYICGVWHAVS